MNKRNRVQPGVPEGGQFAAHKRADADPSVALVDPEQGYEAAKEAAVTYGRHMYNAGQALNNPKLSSATQRNTAELIAKDAEAAVHDSLAKLYGDDRRALRKAREAVGDYGDSMFKAGKVIANTSYGDRARTAATTTIVTDADLELYRALPGAPDENGLGDHDEDEDIVGDDPTACNTCGNYLPTDDERGEKVCRACVELAAEPEVKRDDEADDVSKFCHECAGPLKDGLWGGLCDACMDAAEDEDRLAEMAEEPEGAEEDSSPSVTFEADGDEFSIEISAEGHHTVYRNGNYLGEFYRAGDPEDHLAIEEVARSRLGI